MCLGLHVLCALFRDEWKYKYKVCDVHNVIPSEPCSLSIVFASTWDFPRFLFTFALWVTASLQIKTFLVSTTVLFRYKLVWLAVCFSRCWRKKMLRYETTGSKSKCLCTFRFIKPKANWFLFRIMLLIFSLVCLSCFLLGTTPPAFFLTYSPKVDMSTS